MIGVILLLAITVTGSALVVAFGSDALSDAERNSEVGSVEHAMTQFDSRTSLVGLGGSSVQMVDLGASSSGASVRVEEGRGWMRIRVINDTDSSDTIEVMNQSLGVVEYRNDDTTVAYQGGGVWKATPGGTTMVSPPEFHYRDRTLTLPLVVVGGDDVSSGRVEITEDGPPDPMFPILGDSDTMNPLSRGKVNVTVNSAYYEAWGRFFEERTGGEMDYDHANRSVTITLVVPTNRPPVSSALASTSAQEMVIQGSGGSTFTDSYNSSNSSYSNYHSDNGVIITSGGIEMSGGAEIRGDLVSGSGTVRLGSGNTKITGNLSYGGTTDFHKKATVGGWIANNGTAPEIDHVDGLVDAKIAELSSNNDNAGEQDIDATSNVLNASRSGWELTEGRYYLDEIDITSGTLLLDNSDGNITIAVENDIVLDGSNAKIRVKNGSGAKVEIFMDGSTFTVSGGANVSVPGDRSRKLWIYGPPGTDATFTGTDSKFVGVVYAPDTANRQGEISVDSHAEVFGALVGGKTTLQSGGTVHFDQVLGTVREPVPAATSAPKLTYLHVTVNRVNVTSA